MSSASLKVISVGFDAAVRGAAFQLRTVLSGHPWPGVRERSSLTHAGISSAGGEFGCVGLTHARSNP
jgi:hypothetical protein